MSRGGHYGFERRRRADIQKAKQEAKRQRKTERAESGVTGPEVGEAQDTGAPTLTLTLQRGTYPQDGTPENTSPYTGTSIVLPKSPSAGAKKPAARTAPTARAKVASKSAAKRAHATAKPKRKVAKPKRNAAKHKLHVERSRPPAFVVPGGAPKEPLDEIPLTARAQQLSEWLTPSRRPTASNQRYWLYQHAWIVTGARFGWWHGAAALRLLINIDRRVESQWGIGHQSESVARRALAAVEARAK